MIYTVTFNPAIDYVVHTGRMQFGMVNRSEKEEMYYGGKGINVSYVLKQLGTESVALGFVAGFTGDAIERGVREMGIRTDFVHLPAGNSRINIKIKSEEETELNCQGPDIGEESVEELFHKLESIQDGDTLILAGSIPASMPDDIYEKILDRLKDKEIKIIVDATGKLLMHVLKYRPFLIKPNHHELGAMFGKELTEDEEIISHARKLKELGAKNVLVSMAEKGAILLDEYGKIHKCGACSGEVKNSVGAGDSMVAGFVAGSLSGDYLSALQLGCVCGSATAFSEGLAGKEEIRKLWEIVTGMPHRGNFVN